MLTIVSLCLAGLFFAAAFVTRDEAYMFGFGFFAISSYISTELMKRIEDRAFEKFLETHGVPAVSDETLRTMFYLSSQSEIKGKG